MSGQQNKKLPSINSILRSSQIQSLEDYARWELHKKNAYRAELDHEVELRKQRSRLAQLKKQQQREQANRSAWRQKAIWQQGRRTKMKTEQKYMADNASLMHNKLKQHPNINNINGKHTTLSLHAQCPQQLYRQQPQQLYRQQPQQLYRQHPFVQLLDQAEKRKQTSKMNFLLQNQLNTIQTQMKRSIRDRTKSYEREQTQQILNHEEQYHRKRIQQRENFQKKYLKIKPMEYLNQLKHQAINNSRVKQHKQQKVMQITINPELKSNPHEGKGSPAIIGVLPMSHDRQQQINTLERSLHFFNQDLQAIKPKKQYQKVQTEKAEKEQFKGQYRLAERTQVIGSIARQSVKRSKQMESSFNYYDIICGVSKTYQI